MKMSLTATNNNNNNNDNINGEQELTSYLKSMFIKLNDNSNIDSNPQIQPQQSSIDNATNKIIVNGDGISVVVSNSDVKHSDDRNQCESKKFDELSKPSIITNVGDRQIIDDNNNNVVVVTYDDDSRNKIETKNQNDTLNKINGSCLAVQTNNSSTSSLSASSVMTEEKNNQNIIINSNDQKQDIISEQQPKSPVNDHKLNQSDSFADNNNNNLGNNHHRKKQEPKEIDHTNDHVVIDENDKDFQKKTDQENFINELLQKIPKASVEERKNHQHQPLNTDNNNNPTTITQESILSSSLGKINENVPLNNFESSSPSSSLSESGADNIEKQFNESGVHSDESRCSSVSQVETSSINSIETNIHNNVNQRSNDTDNRIYSRPTSMVEVFDSDIISEVNKQKISNFRFESIKEDRPVTRTRVQELREFWNDRSLITKANQDKK
nr:putative uncharacterized protein DDB_G0282133 [Dermatophagoides farinae]XP_046913685.1 putative uncharacterized protein DDB_G0282133 [Dermatophagoides farinae]XP_046913686.1 putative uncharacterized protein DDB_G0282133 [Dermatophagoides farinae]